LNYDNNLKQILTSLSDGKPAYTQIVELVKYSRIIVTSFLKNKKQSSLLFAFKNGIDINDLVLDIIAELFEKGPDNKLYKLENFTSSLRVPLKDITPSELFYAYYSFIIKLSSIQLARVYSSFDPNGHRIQKNIRETIAQMEGFEIYKCNFDTIYLVKNCKSDGKLNYLDYEDFEKEFLSLAVGKKSTRELLEIIYNILINQDSYRKEIKLNDVVVLFKSYHGYREEIYKEENFTLPDTGNSFVNKFEIEQICNKVFSKIKEKIFVNYFAKGKLNREQAVALVNTIQEIINDWIEFGRSDLSYYQHLSKFLNLDKEEYKLCFKAKLEYLIKEAKKEIALYLDTGY